MKSVILASSSSYRKKLLQDVLGVKNIIAIPPTFSEENFKQEHLEMQNDPKQLSIVLSKMKGESIAKSYFDSIVISGDQVCVAANQIWDKPLNRENAVKTLLKLQGTTHQLITSVSLFYQNQMFEHQDITQLTMAPLNLAQIERYLNFAHPWDCAGSYKIEHGGIGLFSKIETSDHTSIEGIPLLFVRKILCDHLGVKLW